MPRAQEISFLAFLLFVGFSFAVQSQGPFVISCDKEVSNEFMTHEFICGVGNTRNQPRQLSIASVFNLNKGVQNYQLFVEDNAIWMPVESNKNGNDYAGVHVPFAANEGKRFKFVVTAPPQTQGKFDIFAKAQGNVQDDSFLDPWINSTWKNRVQYNITSSQNYNNSFLSVYLNFGFNLTQAGVNCTREFRLTRLVSGNPINGTEVEMPLWIQSCGVGANSTYARFSSSYTLAFGTTTFFLYYNNSNVTVPVYASFYSPTNTTVGLWSFSGNAIDSSLNGLNGSFAGSATTALGLFNTSASLGGTGYVNLPDSSLLRPASDFAVEFFVNPSTIASGTIFDGRQDDIRVYLNADGTVSASAYVSLATPLTSTSTLVVGQWSHIGFQKVGSNCSLFFNGAVEASSTCGAVTWESSTWVPRIGANGAGADIFSGFVDDFRFSNASFYPLNISVSSPGYMTLQQYLAAGGVTADNVSGNFTGTNANKSIQDLYNVMYLFIVVSLVMSLSRR